ncbi:MAG TPA: VOC family protein [Candidatus Limnocylindria bacterium]|nr:VOC family protein [Candidatus Limnocylindria bacterium]
MATQVQVVFDCADPASLSRFWAEALHYKLQDPPEGFASWDDWLRDQGIPESEWNSASAVVDPDGHGPRIYFQRVPEGKVVKNRVHLDLNVGAGQAAGLEEHQRRVDAEVERLQRLGATTMRPGSVERGEYWVVMQDPEGNEFCVQ